MDGDIIKHGPIVKMLRVTYGASQSDLAKEIGMDSSYISRIENGERKPSFQTLTAIAEAVDIPVYLIIYLIERAHNCLSRDDSKQALETELGNWVIETLQSHIDEILEEEAQTVEV